MTSHNRAALTMAAGAGSSVKKVRRLRVEAPPYLNERTWDSAPQMSAFGAKADILFLAGLMMEAMGQGRVDS